MTQAATAPPTATDRPPPKTLAFITGCGRSGTTIIGRLLERHPSVRYLNDRFDLWIRPFPFTDAWGRHVKSAKAGARIALSEQDANVPEAARNWFIGLFDHERGNRPVLVEKLAINNFRLGFVRALCPEAHFVNIVRHGVEVAFSIQQKVDLGHWYGQHDRKWTLLVEHAWANGYGPLVGLCKTAYHRGLLEWRMSVEAAEAYFAKDPSRALRLRYEELIADPVETGRHLREFLGLEPHAEMERFAAEEIRRQNPEASQREIPPGTEEIAGETLRRLGYRI